ncbi:MAG TPA: GAK system CofD-like protein [Desulfonatronum sp.]|nr:GAK system CofD-like protein [Desulfonatronum sp.]
MHTARSTRSVTLPDQPRLARYLQTPELGPRVLFFSGGTALNSLSRKLVHYTHNSIHLVTAFDSGGSSAKLREAFQMPAVGDLRSRLMALADQTIKGNPEILRLFTFRLPMDDDPAFLRQWLDRLCSGRDALIRQIPEPMFGIIRNHLRLFQQHMPTDFDLRGASIGNLILTAGYLSGERRMDQVIFLFSKLAGVRGIVRPITNKYLHLAAKLEDGQWVVGQHLLTGKEVPVITSRVKRICLSRDRMLVDPVAMTLDENIRRMILQAELICYPMGSFYSSLIANLLPYGVGQAIAENDCPKVYIPNTGIDPEQCGMSLADNVRVLLHYLRKGCDAEQPVNRLLNFVLLDTHADGYVQPMDLEKVRDLGVDVIQMPLAQGEQNLRLNEDRLIKVLLSLI